MSKHIGDSFEEVFAKFEEDPEFQKADRMIEPYYYLIVEIVKRRLKLGYTQKDLAKKARTFQSRISKIESGEHDIQLSTLIRIAEALEAKVSIRLLPIEEIVFEPPQDKVYQSLKWVVTHRLENTLEFSDSEAQEAAITRIPA